MSGEPRSARLGELCEFRAGAAFPLPFQGRAHGELPFIKVSDLNRPGNELFISGAENWVDAQAVSSLRVRPVPGSCIIFAKIGEAIRHNRKRLTTRPTLLDNNLMAAVPRPGVDPHFLYYLLCTLDFEEFIEGSALPYLKASVLEQVEVELPPPALQRRFAQVLSTIDERLELGRRLTRTAQALVSRLFQAWFVEFYPVVEKAAGRLPRGMSRQAASLFPARFTLTGQGVLPEGWRWAPLGEVARQVRESGQPAGLGDSTPYLGLEHMPQGSIALPHWGTAAQVHSAKSRFRPGHLLFGKLRPYFHKVGIAPVEGLCSTDIVVVEPTSEAFYSFVLGHLSSPEFIHFADAGSNGTRMPRTSWERMASYPVALPGQRCAQAFDRLARPLLDKLLANIHESRRLLQLRQLVLSRLVSGEEL